MLDIPTTSKIIKEARIKAGLTQEQLADKLFVSKQAVSNWERGMNLPDEYLREKLEEILGIKLRKESMNTIHRTPFFKHIPGLKKLEEIKSVDEITNAVEILVNSVDIDAYEHTVKKMLYLTLVEILGKEIYYEDYYKKFYSDYPLNWSAIASDMMSLIKDEDDWIISENTIPLRTKSIISQKIEIMTWYIESVFYEDFDEEGYRDGYPQQIGKYGQDCGRTLLYLLPEKNTDLMVVYKTAILDIVDTLFEICSDDYPVEFYFQSTDSD